VVNSDLTSLRRFDGSYQRTGKAGFEQLEFYGQTGLTSIAVHPMLRDGDSIAMTEKNAIRIGSTDLTFDLGDSQVWFPVADKSALEVRVIGIQQPVLQRPYQSILFSGQTYT
jgi:hypothetical protein